MAILKSLAMRPETGFAYLDNRLNIVAENKLMSRAKEQIVQSRLCRQALVNDCYVSEFQEVKNEGEGNSSTWWSVNYFPVKDWHQKIIGVIIVAIDMSEQKKNEQRLHQAIVKREEFLSVASHELKTPLTAMKAFLQLMANRCKKSSDNLANHYLDRLNSQADRLIKLASDLLSVSKIEMGKSINLPGEDSRHKLDDGEMRAFGYSYRTLNLSKIIEGAVADFQAITSDYKIILRNKPGIKVRADKDRLSQVLFNFLSNAKKYSPHADRILVNVSAMEGSVRVSVTDYGIGIAPEHQQLVFKRFFRLSDKDAGAMTSLGLGLYISSEIIKAHGGEIGVKSKKSQGSTFYFKLPVIAK